VPSNLSHRGRGNFGMREGRLDSRIFCSATTCRAAVACRFTACRTATRGAVTKDGRVSAADAIVWGNDRVCDRP
jgi:hypothetical protein